MENKIDLVKFQKSRTSVKDVFSKKEGSSVEIAGWVYDTRALGKIKFLVLRDLSGEIQVTAFNKAVSSEIFSSLDKFSRESVLYIKGEIKDSKQAPGGKEIIPKKIIELASANDIPIDVSDFSKTELPKRLDYRFLDLHRKKIQAIFKIESTIMQAFREFMVNEAGAMEAVFPSIIGSSSEGGTELFKAKYFDKEIYLSQSCQLYKQMVACSMEKVFSIFTVWRAEKHNTIRHLNEARQLDFEMAFADEFVVMDVMYKSLCYIIKKVIEVNSEELKILDVKLKVPKDKYMTFAEVVKVMKKEKVQMGDDDLTLEAEKKLGELYPDTVVFVHDWPIKGKTFYIMPKGKELSHGFDAIYKGIEITSGGQRVHIPEILEKQLIERDLKPKDFKSYIDSFRFGAPPHAGWGMGLERITMLLLNLSNIREVTLFPRDRDRITP
jgi:nondiscriminating aspartyl-tRNA synthetase